MSARLWKISCLLLLVLLLALSAHAAPRRLGEGCSVADFSNSCQRGCRWECQGTDVVLKCTQDFGYCFDSENRCVKCDFKQVDDQCEQFQSLNCGADIKNAPNTIFCQDSDNDGWGVKSTCKKKKNLGLLESQTYKSEFLLFGFDECDDGNPTKNGASIWVRDVDADGFWGEVLFQCASPNLPGWQQVTSAPSDDQYDCNDNDANVNNPAGCFCGHQHLGQQLKDAVCLDKKTKTSTQIISPELTSFPVRREQSTRVWFAGTNREDFNGDSTVLCPEDRCPLRWKSEKHCVEPNTFWYDPDDVTSTSPIQGGDHLCKLNKNGKAVWTTRTGTMYSMLVQMGESSGKDYSVYCDKLNKIAHSLSLELFFPFGHVRDYLTALTTQKSSGGVGKGCILTINKPYEKRLRQAEVPGDDDQQVVFGLTLTQAIDDNKYFEIDFSDKDVKEGWLVGMEDGKRNGIFANTNLSLLLFAQANKNGVHSDLNPLFSSVINPNNFWVNFYNFLRNPLKHLSNIADQEEFKEARDFDKSFMGREDNTYIQSVLERDRLIMKVVNPSESEGKELAQFVDNVCNNGLLGKDVECAQADGVTGITLKNVNEEMWEKVSRQLRLQGSNAPRTAELFDAECTEASDCPAKACYNIGTCALGVCQYVPKQSSPTIADGCCPKGLTSAEDADCPAPAQLQLGFKSSLKGACDPTKNEIALFSINKKKNAHAAYGTTYQHKVCVAPEVGTFGRQSEPNCNVGTKVITLSDFKNAHAAGPVNTDYTHSVCLSHSEYEIACKVDSKSGCQGWRTLVSLTNTKNAHLGRPDMYSNKLCCRWVGRDVKGIT